MRCACNVARSAALESKVCNVDGVEPVHVLLDTDSVQNGLFVDALWKRKLNQDSRDFWIVVQLVDRCNDFFLSGSIRHLLPLVFNPNMITSLFLHFDIER